MFVTGAGDNIEYILHAVPTPMRKRCVIPFPVGEFGHDGKHHKCSTDAHTCTETCDACGYYCELEFRHNGPHDCTHGNMKKTTFYATDDVVDIGENRRYKVGDSGIAEMCHIYCERRGRGHIHLEVCKYGTKDKCPEKAGLRGIRHQSKQYIPHPELEKDEVTHSKYWRRKNWKDPCTNADMKKEFDKCNFGMLQPYLILLMALHCG